MNFFKELWFIVSAIFKSSPKSKDKMEIVQMRNFPFDGYLAMSWCGYLITRKRPEELKEIDINHETIHLYQAKDEGSWYKYYLKYFWEWIKGGAFFTKYSYYTIKYEVEAYSKEREVEYIDQRKKGDVENFNLQNRKETFKKFKWTFDYKEWLRTNFKDI